MLQLVVEILFLASIAVLTTGWLLYPCTLALMVRVRTRPPSPEAIPIPNSVSILIAAYNEESVIGDRLRNLSEIELPEKVEILLGIDAADDRTAERADEWVGKLPGLTIVKFTERRGKLAVINDLFARSTGDVLIFSDANTQFSDDAVSQMLSCLSDPNVGGVCGRLLLTRPGMVAGSEARYWSIENWLKENESKVDSCLGANGGIFALRRARFWTDIPPRTIVEDFVFGMKVRESGYRMLYCPTAIAYEEAPEKTGVEWHRRVRIGAGNFHALLLCWRCLLPRYGFFAWAFLCHKVVRWFSGHLALLALMSAAVLILDRRESTIDAFASLTVGLAAAYGAVAAVGSILAPTRLARFPQLCFHCLVIMSAIFFGFGVFVVNRQHVAWKKTER